MTLEDLMYPLIKSLNSIKKSTIHLCHMISWCIKDHPVILLVSTLFNLKSKLPNMPLLPKI